MLQPLARLAYPKLAFSRLNCKELCKSDRIQAFGKKKAPINKDSLYMAKRCGNVVFVQVCVDCRTALQKGRSPLNPSNSGFFDRLLAKKSADKFGA